ncbi:hypothetical protein FLONG3_8686 [Fusarium longipes]|uniref:Uncharacterized protein n=1 Tax=Fusarium longipes TaxID=694270 RepID=A0A395S3S8_9HYPO|nr:hypothetical protein FLONG3_8686 [Fusarium longipes]
MGRTSDHIHFPRHVERIPRRTNGSSGYSDSLGRAVLIDIINYFADVVDAIEDIKLPKQHKDRTKLKNDKKKLCDTVVRGANTFSALFNAAKSQTKFTDLAPKNLPLYRDEINSQLLYPLSKAKSSLSRSFSFAPYQQKLMAILNVVETEICWWLKIPRPAIAYDKGLAHTSKGYSKSSTAHSYSKTSAPAYSKSTTHNYGKGSTTHTHTTSKSHGQRSTQSSKTHDQRSSRPTQARGGQQRQKRSSSPPDKSGGCAVM